MTKRWVKFKANNAVKVSTEQCQDVDDFIEACKKKLLFLYGQFPPGELYLSTTDGGPPFEPDDPVPAQNTAKTPLFIRVLVPELEYVTGGLQETSNVTPESTRKIAKCLNYFIDY